MFYIVHQNADKMCFYVSDVKLCTAYSIVLAYVFMPTNSNYAKTLVKNVFFKWE